MPEEAKGGKSPIMQRRSPVGAKRNRSKREQKAGLLTRGAYIVSNLAFALTRDALQVIRKERSLAGPRSDVRSREPPELGSL